MIFTGKLLVSQRTRWRLIRLVSMSLLLLGPSGPGFAKDAPIAGVNMRLLPYLDRAGVTPIRELARLNDARLELVRKAGFNFVRIGIPADAWIENVSPAQQDEVLTLLRGVLDSAISANLGVDVALFTPARQIVCENRDREPYRLALNAVLSQLPDRPDVGIEPINEPPSCRETGSAAFGPWQEFQPQLYREVRSMRRNILFVVAGPGWGRVDGLPQLDPGPYRADPNAIFTFHYYEPFLFTHQEVAWLRPDHLNKFVAGLAWPAEKTNADAVQENALAALAGDASFTRDRQAESRRVLVQLFEEYRSRGTAGYLATRFQAAADWAEAHGVAASRMLLGEFGVHRHMAADRVGEPWATAPAWLAAVRREAEDRHFGWVVWDLDSGFGVVCGNRPGEGEICPAYRTVFGK
jgi:endoglucanase